MQPIPLAITTALLVASLYTYHVFGTTSTLATAVLVFPSVVFFLFYTDLSGQDNKPQETTKDEPEATSHDDAPQETSPVSTATPTKKRTFRVLYGTTTGRAKSLAIQIASLVDSSLFEVDYQNLAEYDQDNLEQEDFVVFIVSTWTGGAPPESCKVFFDWLTDHALDFRVSRTQFSKIKYAVFGLGNSEYDEDYCTCALNLDQYLTSLGGNQLAGVEKGDDNVDFDNQFTGWAQKILRCLDSVHKSKKKQPRKKTRTKAERRLANQGKNAEADKPVELTEEDLINDQMLTMDQIPDSDDEENKTAPRNTIADLEDLGAQFNLSSEREMVTPAQRKALTKEGYKIIGTHSAVKLCRWTKHHLRGRGGCYKHTFYGITSYQCMEATPSLACANKCVFCWRHHKNPVGREWRWKTDEPAMIVEEAITKHQKMIKELKGVPGVQMARWNEAFTVRHCALSLVGEPIMYPQINEMMSDLHRRKISTFMVTNAQFPDKIDELDPVTQLYVSIDAANKDSLKAIDRPLFKDFWERFLESLRALKRKGQRTVYRLTLVKKWNMSDSDQSAELDEYIRLIEIGQPDFIEIKAVTYCGTSDASTLTMENVPWHTEVRNFAAAICERTNGKYGTACEHVHSCCTLLAKSEYKIEGKWHTWINYDKFHELVDAYHATDGEATFSSMDYMAETPDWAVWGAKEEGFDPVETRFYRTSAGAVKKIQYEATESGCG